jgi:serine/threonine-protein kinase
MIRAGTVLGERYRVVRHVGSGGMASVYLAEDDVLARRVAVKVVHADTQSERGRRIRREARLGAGMRHPHLVTVYDVLVEDEALLLVMEYVEGETLADVVKRGPLPPDRALAVLKPVADALDHAHAAGVVHRDVKPANVLVGAGGVVKLSDLGIATSDEVTQITRTGGTVGTAAYMAPEQFEPGPVTRAVDVYALGAVAYEVLTGRRAFSDVTPPQLFARLREDAPPPDLAKARPDLPEAAARAVARGMASRAEDRPSSACELVTELADALGEPDPQSDPVPELLAPAAR